MAEQVVEKAKPADMKRNDSSIWDWNTNVSPPSSLKGSNPGSRNPSQHGGNAFGRRPSVSFSNLEVLGDQDPARVQSPTSMYDKWPSPPSSRGNSLHGGSNFANVGAAKSPGDGAGAPALPDEADAAGSKPFRRSMSFVWDWAWGRGTPPASRGASLHGGKHFANVNDESAPSADAVPPAAMKRRGSFSMWDWSSTPKPSESSSPDLTPNSSREGSQHGGRRGSFLWDWSAGRRTPGSQPGSRNPSAHGGSAFAPGGAPVNIGDDASAPAAEAEVVRADTMWDWAWGRKTPPASRGASLHGGNAFKPSSPPK